MCRSVKHHPSLWVHIDAAWAGMSFACPEYRELGHLESINEFAHSFCTNFHKVYLISFTCCLMAIDFYAFYQPSVGFGKL